MFKRIAALLAASPLATVLIAVLPVALVVLPMENSRVVVRAQSQATPAGEPGTVPETTPDSAPKPRRAMPKPANLQVLPKDMSGAEVMKVMHTFEGQLGVECGFCHATDAATHRLNFASDVKPEKATARLMMRMTTDINEKYLTQVNDPDHADHPAPPVTCATCHRGQSMPAAFTPVPEAEHH